MLKKIFKEPLFQFLLAGAALFFLSALVGERPASDGKAIVVSPQRIEQLRAGWQKRWQRPPSDKELQGLIDQYVREEVLYREGLAMGLDQNDTVIRRRVAQKVEFLVQDLAAAQAPGDAKLMAYFERHREQYTRPARITFTHLYFNEDRRGPKAEADAQEQLRRLENGGKLMATSGDALMLNSRYADVTEDQVARDFGREFAEAIFTLPLGAWQGPVRSGYGVHLVRVTARDEASPPAFDQVREKVRTAYLDERRREQNEAIIRGMTGRYQIIIEGITGQSAQPVAEKADDGKGSS